jgi:tetratricopeptide (TPR) repeat protein
MMMTWRSLLPVLALGAVLALTPLYTAQTAQAAGSDTPSTDDKDKDTKEGKAYQEIQDLLKKAQFEPALAALKPYTKAYPDDADGWNLLGYTSRKLGHYDVAFDYYERALAIEPNHKGALEYMGELYVELGQKDTAMDLLAKLRNLCPRGCSELAQLQGFIDGASETAQRAW